MAINMILREKGIYFFFLFSGSLVYLLKLISISQILDNLSISAYPLLMLAQAVITFIILKLISYFTKNRKYFYYVSLFLPIIPILLSYLRPEQENIQIIVYSSVFFIATVAISLIEVTLQNLQLYEQSVFRSESSHDRYFLCLEIGSIVTALTYIALGEYTSLFSIVTLIITISILFSLISFITNAETSVESTAEKKTYFDPKKINLSFINLIYIFLICVSLYKFIHGFAVMWGINELKNNGEYSTKTIFSFFFICQNILILSGLSLKSYFNKNTNSDWKWGYNLYSFFQAICAVAMLVFQFPILYLVSGAVRKVSQKLILNTSQIEFLRNIPESKRLIFKKKNARLTLFWGYLILAISSALVINDIISIKVLWLNSILLFIAITYLSKTLLKKFNNYHVSSISTFHINNTTLNETVESTAALANPESAIHYERLCNILEQNPRPILKKAIFRTLGKMRNPDVVSTLLSSFNNCKKEDEQIECIKALSEYSNPNITLFFKQTLEKVFIEDTERGQLRRELCLELSKHIDQIVLISCLEMLDKFKDDPELDTSLANVIEVLDDFKKIANSETSTKTIDEKLAKFLPKKYTKKVRTAALKAIADNPKYKKRLAKAFEEYKSSNEDNDLSAISYIAGEKKLFEHKDLVYQISENRNHKNSTVLASLIQLNHEKSFQLMADILVEEQGNMRHIHNFYRIKDNADRYKVIEEVFKSNARNISNFFNDLQNSGKNFDRECQLILSEANRKEIKLEVDSNFF